MIDVFYRRREVGEFVFPRVMVTTAPDTERAQHLIETLKSLIDPEGECPAAGGRASRRRGTVAKLAAFYDRAMAKEQRETLAAAQRPMPNRISRVR